LQPGGESLGFGYPFNFNGYRIHRCFDPFQSVADGAQLTWWDRPRLQPFGDETHDGEAKYEGDDSGNYPGEHLVNDEIWIRRHFLPSVVAT
jgi:hypothetical protein